MDFQFNLDVEVEKIYTNGYFPVRDMVIAIYLIKQLGVKCPNIIKFLEERMEGLDLRGVGGSYDDSSINVTPRLLEQINIISNEIALLPINKHPEIDLIAEIINNIISIKSEIEMILQEHIESLPDWVGVGKEVYIKKGKKTVKVKIEDIIFENDEYYKKENSYSVLIDGEGSVSASNIYPNEEAILLKQENRKYKSLFSKGAPHSCPDCKSTEIALENQAEYEATIGDIKITVENIVVPVCKKCGKMIITENVSKQISKALLDKGLVK